MSKLACKSSRMDFSSLHSSIPPLPNARQLIPIPLEDGNRHRDPRRGCVVLEVGRPEHLAGAVSSCSSSSLAFNLRGTWSSSAHFFQVKAILSASGDCKDLVVSFIYMQFVLMSVHHSCRLDCQ